MKCDNCNVLAKDNAELRALTSPETLALLKACESQFQALRIYWRKPSVKNEAAYDITVRTTARAISTWGKKLVKKDTKNNE